MLTLEKKIERPIESYTIPVSTGMKERDTAFSVFMVDDDVLFLRSLEHHLQHKLKRNIKITSFPNGEECIKHLNQKPDVVILDHILNGQFPNAMNGVAVLRKIKQVDPDVVVIMVSGQENMQVAIDTMKYGAYDYVIKNENAFLKVQNAIKNAIHNIQLTRELKNYKRWMRVILAVLAAAFLIAIIIQVFFPKYFHLQE